MHFKRLDYAKVKAIAVRVKLDKLEVSVLLKQFKFLLLGHLELALMVFHRALAIRVVSGSTFTLLSLLTLFICLPLPLVILTDHPVCLVAQLAYKLLDLPLIRVNWLLKFLAHLCFQDLHGPLLTAINADVGKDLRDLRLLLEV